MLYKRIDRDEFLCYTNVLRLLGLPWLLIRGYCEAVGAVLREVTGRIGWLNNRSGRPVPSCHPFCCPVFSLYKWVDAHCRALWMDNWHAAPPVNHFARLTIYRSHRGRIGFLTVLPLQRLTAVTALFSSKQLLLFAEQCIAEIINPSHFTIFSNAPCCILSCGFEQLEETLFSEKRDSGTMQAYCHPTAIDGGMVLTLSVRRPTLEVRIWRQKTSDSDV